MRRLLLVVAAVLVPLAAATPNPPTTTCAPPPFTSNATAVICVSCPEEPSCTFSYTLQAPSGAPSAPTSPPNTSPTTATIALDGLTQEGEYSFVVHAVDGTAQAGPPTAVVWTVDTTPPDTSFTYKSFGSDGSPVRSEATFTLACSEPQCTFEYKLDDAEVWQAPDGGTGSINASLVTTTVPAGPARLLRNTTAVFSLGMDTGDFPPAGAFFRVSLDGGPAVTHAAPSPPITLAFSGLAQGGHVLSATAVAGDGTVDRTPAEYAFTVDTTPPNVTVFMHPPTGSDLGVSSVFFGADEGNPVFHYREAPTADIATAVWESTTQGAVEASTMEAATPHSFEVWAEDPAGNQGPTTSVSWVPAGCPAGGDLPSVAITSSDEAIGPTSRVIRFEADGAWPEFEASVNGMPFAPATSPLILSSLPTGAPLTASVRAAVPFGCDAAVAATRPAAATVEWTSLPLDPAPGDSAGLVSAPLSSSPLVFADFEFNTTHPRLWPQYSLNSQGFANCGNTLRLGPLASVDHQLELRAVDDSGTPVGLTVVHQWAVTAAANSTVARAGLTDNNYTMQARARDPAGNLEDPGLSFTWRVDVTAPDVEATLTSPPFTIFPNVSIDVACRGEVDPCEFCWTSDDVADGCSLNTTLFLTTTSGDGAVAVVITATDSVGLVSTPSTVTWTVDFTPPLTELSPADDALVPNPVPASQFLTNSSMVTLNATANEPVSAFQIRVDGALVDTATTADGATTTEFITVGPLADDVTHTISVTAVDLATNVDADPPSLTVVVDSQPPTTTLTAVPPPLIAAPTFSVSVSAADTAAGTGVRGISVLVNGEEMRVEGESGTVDVIDATTGNYTIVAHSVDVAGNWDPVGATTGVRVDLQPPTSQFVSVAASFYALPNVTVEVSVDEAAALEVGLDVGDLDAGGQSTHTVWAAVPASSRTFTFAGLADGKHAVYVRAVDLAGNTQRLPLDVQRFEVDTVAPVVSLLRTNGTSRWETRAGAELCVSVVDRTPVTFSSSTGALASTGALTACVELESPTDGAKQLWLTATDAAGNAGNTVQVSWTVDRQPPAVVETQPVAAASDCPATDAGGVLICAARAAPRVEVTCDPNAGGAAASVAPCDTLYSLFTLSEFVYGDCNEADTVVAATSPPAPAAAVAPTGVLSLATPVDGLFQLSLGTRDAAGNAAGAPPTTFYVDSDPPAAPVVDAAPADRVEERQADFTVRLSGDVSPGQIRLWYTLDSGPETAVPTAPPTNNAPVSFSVPADGSDLLDGTHRVEVWAVDAAGHAGAVTVHEWDVASEAPEVHVLEEPAPVSGDSTPSFVFQAVWPNSSLQTGPEPAATIVVELNNINEEVACDDTTATGGLCTWSIALTDPVQNTLTVRADLNGVRGTPVARTWEFVRCSTAQYAEVDDDFGIVCLPCPAGANCNTVGSLTGVDDLVALPGFWAPPASNGLNYYTCPREESCLEGGDRPVGNTTVFSRGDCLEGYAGTLCAVCADGWFDQFGDCEPCATTSSVAWVITAMVGIFLVVAGVLFFRFRDYLPVDQLKVALSFAQIIASANTAYSIPWPPAFAGFLNGARIFLMEAVAITRTSCAAPLTFYSSLVITLVGFKVITAGIVWIPYLLHKCRARKEHAAMPAVLQTVLDKRRRQSTVPQLSAAMSAMVTNAETSLLTDWAKIFKITFLFLFVAYPGVSLKIMQTFKCVEVEGDFWLVADMRLKCFTGEWYGYAVYAAVMGCLYTAGLPALILAILIKNRYVLDEPATRARWGFLYAAYGSRAYLWEVEELARKLWLTSLVVLMSEDTPLQVTVAVLVSGWAHVMHALYKPWLGVASDSDRAYTYILQHTSLSITTFVFLMGLLFKVEGVAHGSSSYDFLSWAMLVGCCAFGAAAVGVLARSTRLKIKEARAAVVRTGTSSARKRSSRRKRPAGDAEQGGETKPLSGGDKPNTNREAATPMTVRRQPLSRAARAAAMSTTDQPEGKSQPEAGLPGMTDNPLRRRGEL